VIWLWACAGAAAVYGVHRLAVWAEGRGWIYYRTKKMPSGAAGRAMMELAAIVEPEIEHVIEAIDQDAVRAERDETGEPRRASGAVTPPPVPPGSGGSPP